jgi:hypothetical protein
MDRTVELLITSYPVTVLEWDTIDVNWIGLVLVLLLLKKNQG